MHSSRIIILAAALSSLSGIAHAASDAKKGPLKLPLPIKLKHRKLRHFAKKHPAFYVGEVPGAEELKGIYTFSNAVSLEECPENLGIAYIKDGCSNQLSITWDNSKEWWVWSLGGSDCVTWLSYEHEQFELRPSGSTQWTKSMQDLRTNETKTITEDVNLVVTEITYGRIRDAVKSLPAHRKGMKAFENAFEKLLPKMAQSMKPINVGHFSPGEVLKPIQNGPVVAGLVDEGRYKILRLLQFLHEHEIGPVAVLKQQIALQEEKAQTQKVVLEEAAAAQNHAQRALVKTKARLETLKKRLDVVLAKPSE